MSLGGSTGSRIWGGSCPTTAAPGHSCSPVVAFGFPGQMSPPREHLQVAGWWHMVNGTVHGTWQKPHGTQCMAHGAWHTLDGTRRTARGTRCHTAHGVRQLARREQHVGLGTASLRALRSTWQQHGTRHRAHGTEHTPSSTHHGAHGTARMAQHTAHGTGLMAHSTWHMVHGTRLTARGRGIELGRGRSTALSLPPLPWIFRPAAQRGGSPVAGRLRHNFKAVAAPKHSSYKALLLLSPAGGFQVTNPC